MGLIIFMRICYEMYYYFLMMLNDCYFDASSNIYEFFMDFIILLMLGITCLKGFLFICLFFILGIYQIYLLMRYKYICKYIIHHNNMNSKF
jgi:hypothetical protein